MRTERWEHISITISISGYVVMTKLKYVRDIVQIHSGRNQ